MHFDWRWDQLPNLMDKAIYCSLLSNIFRRGLPMPSSMIFCDFPSFCWDSDWSKVTQWVSIPQERLEPQNAQSQSIFLIIKYSTPLWFSWINNHVKSSSIFFISRELIGINLTIFAIIWLHISCTNFFYFVGKQ